jgi:2-polyprenyl-6-methoxyphenol hydroxylase-like FAD-dependent oxidoreductase
MTKTSVLIAGAGPTGLVLAISLARRGVRFRLIDGASGPGEHSRAMVVHARTLEFYSQFGFADEMVGQGIKVGAAHLRESSEGGGFREITAVSFSDLGDGISPYPFALCFPQDDHEHFLLRKLEAAGGAVDWNAKLTGFVQDGRGVHATIEHAQGRTEEAEADYICGCDGAHSVVRDTLELGFRGGTYDQLFYVADTKIAAGFRPDLYVSLGAHILALMLPVRSSGMQRLIGLVPADLSNRQDLTFESIRANVEPLLDVKVTEVNWFATYRVHHRVAERFRVSRAFLLGDAGHIHSPAGGQGMNTGIGDAVNLGWKLADVLHGRAEPALLDTYETERIAFARTLVSTTDRAFTSLVAQGLRGEVTRRILAPLFFSLATRFTISRHVFFRRLSQTHIHYPDSRLSEGKAGRVRGGDRLPWVKDGAKDNFAPLISFDWQIHVYGKIDAEFKASSVRLDLPLQHFEWSNGARNAGLQQNAAYLVRPDGYVALAYPSQNSAIFADFVNRRQLRFCNPSRCADSAENTG